MRLGLARARLALHQAASEIDPEHTNPHEAADLRARIAQLMAEVAPNPQPYRADTDEGTPE